MKLTGACKLKMAFLGSILGAPFFYALEAQEPERKASNPEAGGSQALQAFPTREILEAVQKGERLIEEAAASKNEDETIFWDPWAEPEASRSWLYMNLAPEVLSNIRKNRDEKGTQLFADERR